jgi:hypothetical protein
MPRGFGKRTAPSPLSSEFDKKSKLGLTDKESRSLNTSQEYQVAHLPPWRNPEDVKTSCLAVAFQTVALHAEIIDKDWSDVVRCEEYIGQLSRREQLDLASIWIKARETNNWTAFAIYRALRPFRRCATVATALYSYKSGRTYTSGVRGIG